MAPLVILLVCALSASAFEAPSQTTTEDNIEVIFPQPRIIGGTAVTAPIPYQVSLRAQVDPMVTNPTLFKHYCGATLVTRNILITAAHCFDGPLLPLMKQGRIYAVIGTHLKNFNPSTTFVSQVHQLIKHPKYDQYDENQHHNDVAVVKLKNSAPIHTINVNIIPMRSNSSTVGEKCQISGWGTERFGNNVGSKVLRVATVPIVDTKVCYRKYTSLKFVFSEDMLCAGEVQGGKDTCQGDSGGPLVCGGELTGVVSWGYKCGLPEVPGIYSSVAYHMSWIVKAIGELDSPYPTQYPIPNVPPMPVKPSSGRRPTLDASTGVLVFTVIFIRMSIRFL